MDSSSLIITFLFFMCFFLLLMCIRFIVRKNFTTFLFLFFQITLISFLLLCLIYEVGVAWYVRVPVQIIGITIPFGIIINDLKNRNKEVGYLHILDFLYDIFFRKKHEHKEYTSKNNIKIKNTIHNMVNIRKISLNDIEKGTDAYKKMHRFLVHLQTKVYKGQYQDAHDIYSFFCRIFPDNPVLSFNQGCICFYLQHYNEASKYFLRTIDNIKKYKKSNTAELIQHKTKPDMLEPSDIIYNETITKFNLAVSRHAAGRLKDAVNGYKEILNKKPDDKMINENLASAAIMAGNLELGYQTMEKLNSDDILVKYQMAEILFDLKRYEHSREILTEIEDYESELAGYWYLRGYINIKLKKHELAIKNFEKHIRINVNDEKAFYELGKLYYYNSDMTKAARRLERVLILNEESEKAAYLLGRIYEEEKIYKKAENMYKKVLEINKNNIRTANRLVDILVI
jgi:tetratricopeptide (TPR) repeat protein